MNPIQFGGKVCLASSYTKKHPSARTDMLKLQNTLISNAQQAGIADMVVLGEGSNGNLYMFNGDQGRLLYGVHQARKANQISDEIVFHLNQSAAGMPIEVLSAKATSEMTLAEQTEQQQRASRH